MKKYISLFLLLISPLLVAQESKSLNFDGNFRYALIGNGTGEDGLSNAFSAVRSRVGLRYTINETHSFRARLATTFTDEFEAASFTIKADGPGLAFGSITFDEFYYRFQNENYDVKLGRFQHSIGVRSNAGRSFMRFQSNLVSVHWTDGIYAKRSFDNDWYGELVLEYQHKDNITYPYQGTLDFGNSDHNMTTYFGLENRTRDNNNVIQKGVGLLLAPNAYNTKDGYTTYAALTSRITFDIPNRNLLKGGSFRIAGELGQNLSTSTDKGTMGVLSVGVNNVAEQHEFMLEFAKTDREWLLANVYARNGEEIELRYRFFASKNLNFDARYRARVSRVDNAAYAYSTFLRINYSF